MLVTEIKILIWNMFRVVVLKLVVLLRGFLMMVTRFMTFDRMVLAFLEKRIRIVERKQE